MTVLRTDRLVLREFTGGDSEFIVELLNQPSFVQFIGDKGVRTLDDATKYLEEGPIASYAKHGFGLWAVETREERKLVGMCGLIKRTELEDVDVGFAFLPDHWRRGYASESGEAALRYGFDHLGLQRIVAVTQPDNHGSIATLEKMKMRLEGTTRLIGEDIELLLYAIDK